MGQRQVMMVPTNVQQQQQQAIMQQVMMQQQMLIRQLQHQQHQQAQQQANQIAAKPPAKKQPTQVKDIDISAVQEFKPKALVEAEAKNEEPKRAEVGEWPNLPWEDKNGRNPKERYILQCSTMQWLSDPAPP